MWKVLKYVNRLGIRRHHQLAVLGIETTCDDTCAAIVTDDGHILSDVKSSQYQFHLDMGGILPLVARDKHSKNIANVISQALKESNLNWENISAICVANEPGLELSLRVGVDYAQQLALKYNKALIGVHHMEAHSLIAKLTHPQLRFPFLALLISGGHSLLVLVKDINLFYTLGDTLDNPIGETLDKIARRLKVKNLGPPFDKVCGGQALELLAQHGNSSSYSFGHRNKRSFLFRNSCDFSFASYKSYIENLIEDLTDDQLPVDSPLPQVMDIAASVQYLFATHLATRVHRAVQFLESTNILNLENPQDIELIQKDYTQTGSTALNIQVVISGGVACNHFITNLIEKYCEKMEKVSPSTSVEVIVPSPRHLCTDNGVMIAWSGMLKLINRHYFEKEILKERQEILSLKVNPDAAIGIDVRDQLKRAAIKVKSVNI